jgi:plastocyanin
MSVSRLAAVAALSLAFTTSVAAQPAVVTVAVWNFNFSPKPIHLAAGKPVTLVFVNRSGGSHDFTAKKFFASSRILAGSAPDGEIDLAGNQTKSITLVPAPGTYNAHCSHFLHKQMGMQDLIVVD